MNIKITRQPWCNQPSATADININNHANEKQDIKEVIQCAEANGWHVDAEKHQDKNIVIFEFSQFTPAGQDFFFSATMQGRSLESLVSDMEEYYEGFDADSEAYLWLDGNGHGKNGAPYRMKDVLADMEAAEGMVCKLLEAVRGLAD